MTVPRILVTGASGSTGRETVRALQGDGHTVRALVHREDARTDRLRELGAEIVLGDLLDIDSVRAALEGIDAAYFAYPIVPGIIDATAYFAQAAREAGVRAVVNMSQASARRHSTSHAQQNHWIAEQVFDRSGLPVTHIRPNLFAEWLLYPFTLRPLVTRDVLALPFGYARFAPLTAYDQGRVIAAVLVDPSSHPGRVYQLDGPVIMDGTGMAEALSDVLERTIRHAPVSVEEFQAAVTPIPVLGTYFAQHIGGLVADLDNGLWATDNDAVTAVTGAAPMTIQEFVRHHRTEFARQETGTAA